MSVQSHTVWEWAYSLAQPGDERTVSHSLGMSVQSHTVWEWAYSFILSHTVCEWACSLTQPENQPAIDLWKMVCYSWNSMLTTKWQTSHRHVWAGKEREALHFLVSQYCASSWTTHMLSAWDTALHVCIVRVWLIVISSVVITTLTIGGQVSPVGCILLSVQIADHKLS